MHSCVQRHQLAIKVRYHWLPSVRINQLADRLLIKVILQLCVPSDVTVFVT